MVDPIPLAQTEYRARPGSGISRAYKSIVEGANSDVVPDENQLKRYEEADKFLNSYTETTFMGETQKTPVESDILKKYNEFRTAFQLAVAKYRSVLGSHNMSDPNEQQMWQAEAPVLQDQIDRAYASWRAGGADLVEKAQDIMASSMNDAVSQAINDAQERMGSPLNSGTTGGSRWFLSYAMPDGWSTDKLAPSFSDFRLSSSNLNTSMSSESTSYGGGGGFGAGLWSVGGGFNSSETSIHKHMDSDNFDLHCKIGLVQVFRPWFDQFLFGLSNWSMTGVGPGGIANGTLNNVDDLLLPLVPVAFVVARDVTIESNFSNSDYTFLQESLSP